MNKSIHILAALIMPLIALTGCNDDNDKTTPTTDLFSVFATLDSTNDNGSVFTTCEKDDSPLVTLTSNKKFDTKNVTVGNRYLISYTNGTQNAYKSGAIELYAIQQVANGKVQTSTAAEIQRLSSDPIAVKYIERTGTYINLQCSAPINTQAKVFNLYADKESLDTESAELYLCFESDNSNAMADKQFFGSFDIATILNNPDYKQITIHYRGATGSAIFTISRGNVSIKPVE